jgi:hypothetical protein
MAIKKSKLLIGPFRISFPWLHAPQPPMEGDGDGSYGLTALLPPGYDISPIEAALVEAAKEKWGPDQGKWPRLKFPPNDRIKPCEEKAHLGGYNPGWKFLPMTSKGAPGVVDAMKNLLAHADIKKEAYPGRWARASANPFAWDTGKGVRGVSLGLSNVQLLQHDEPFTSKPRAEDEFDEVAEAMNEAAGWKG